MSVYDKDLLSGLDKVQTAIKRIQQYCSGKKTLVAFSGGKDSQCCYHLCKMAGIDFSAQYSITRFEPPELIQFIRKEYPDVIFRRAYKMSLIEQIGKAGLPSRWFRWCCDAKHKKTNGFDIAVIGIRWAESARRKARWSMFGLKQDRSAYICPICDWTDSDVWEFLDSNHINHCCLYDQGYKRIGCVCCPLNPSLRDAERYPKFVAMLKMGFMKCINRNGNSISEKTKKLLEKYRENPDLYFNNWIKFGTTVPRKYENDQEPCLFAGTGFSESDGQQDDDNL